MRISKSKKKAQFYLFTAILLCGMALAITAPIAATSGPSKDFKELYSNYIREGDRVVNSAIFNSENLTDKFSAFTSDFLEFARQKDKDFGLIFLLSENSAVSVGNYLGSDVTISTSYGSYSIGDGVSVLNATDYVSIMLGEDNYRFNFEGSAVQFMALFRSGKYNNIRVYVKDE